MEKWGKVWVGFWLTALAVVCVWGSAERAKRPFPGADEQPFKVPL